MSRCYFASLALVLVPGLVSAQSNQNTGGTSFSGGGQQGGSFSGGNQSGSTGMGTFGRPNTTLLGSQVELGFNSVFGTAPSIANTDPDPFAAYRPSDSATASSSLNGGFSGTGGFGTTGRTNTNRNNSLAGSNLSSGVLGGGGGGGSFGTANRGGGGLAGGGGGLAGNRLGAGGGQLGAMNRGTMAGNVGANRGMTFGNNFLGGGMNFLGSSNFLGGGMNQNNQPAPMGYRVNFVDSKAPASAPVSATLTVHVEARDRLAGSPALQGSQNLQVLMAGDTAVLRGIVLSDNAKRLASALALLEPGVYNVDNQLVVASPLPAPQPVK
jgi:hypothetical protein